jgi:RimJ/RimL family protein N-acetyltransferase
METYHYTYKDSSKSTPHYTISFTSSREIYIGEYSIMGHYLYNVHLSPEYRGKGLCKVLVKHAIDRKKGLYLDVDPDNIAAIKCYKSCGFIFKKELKNYHHRSWGENVEKHDVMRFIHPS